MSVLIPADGGQPFGPGASGVIKIRGDQTAGHVGVIEQALEVGRIIRPHRHNNDVWLQVIEGDVGVRVGDETVLASHGSWVLKPRGVTHAMWNAGSVDARVMEVFTPAGFEEFMREVAEADEKGELSEEKFNILCKLHGIVFFEDWPDEDGWLEKTKNEYGLDGDPDDPQAKR